MHYWIGTTVQVQESQRRPGPVSVHDQTRIKNKSAFESGVLYQLYNIKPEGGKVIYHFTASTGPDYDLYLEFESTGAAENYIAAALNEELPDYASYHNRRS